MSLFDTFEPNRKRYGTGVWPFVNPRPWDFNPPSGEGAIIDPVAIAFEVTPAFQRMGWPGLSLMSQQFQLELLDTGGAEIEGKIVKWYEENRDRIADEMKNRLPRYKIGRLSDSADTAMREACKQYGAQVYLVVVRALMPEFERVGRRLVTDRIRRTSQAQVIRDLKDALNETPLINDDPLEVLTTMYFVEETLFAICRTEADAKQFGSKPNRHAELHGFESYDNLQGASLVLCAADVVFNFAGRLVDLGFANL